LGKVLSSLKRISLSARFFIRSCFLTGLTSFLKLIFSFWILGQMGVLSLGSGALFGMSLVIFGWTMKWYLKMRASSWEKTDRAVDSLKDSLLQSKFVRFFQKTENERLQEVLFQEAKGWIETNTRLNSMHLVVSGCLALISLWVIFWGAKGVQAGTLTLPQFVLIKSQLAAAFLPLRSWILESRQALEAAVDIGQVFQILQTPLPQGEKKNSLLLKDERDREPAFKFNHVSFFYEKGTSESSFIHDISFSFPYGKKGALVGPTGGGKSTLLHLMCGLLQPSQGEVRLLGHDLKTIKSIPPTLVHFIPQDSYLFHQTLRYNITYGCSFDLKEEEIWEALRLVGLSGWVRALPQGLNTWAGDLGNSLSGGERQRVALARALLLKPEILLLDETTNALDETMEQKIMTVLQEKIPTLIIATHKTSFLSSLDWVVEVSQGALKPVSSSARKRSHS
jgi:ATP-binding cassette subfamily B protein